MTKIKSLLYAAPLALTIGAQLAGAHHRYESPLYNHPELLAKYQNAVHKVNDYFSPYGYNGIRGDTLEASLGSWHIIATPSDMKFENEDETVSDRRHLKFIINSPDSSYVIQDYDLGTDSGLLGVIDDNDEILAGNREVSPDDFGLYHGTLADIYLVLADKIEHMAARQGHNSDIPNPFNPIIFDDKQKH